MTTPRFRDLAFPDDLLYLVEHQVWARLHDDGQATVGITALGIALAGEIYMCRAKPIDSVVEQGRSIAVVELAKSIVSVKSPLSGRVIDVNPMLANSPEIVHADPYGEGWIARIEPAALTLERTALLQGEGVLAAMTEHARLYQVD